MASKVKGISVFWSDQLSCWAFADKKHKINSQPFEDGMNNIISEAVVSYIGADVNQFRIMLSGEEFPGAHSRLLFKEEEHEGAWYEFQKDDGEIMKGWLHPALYDYFKQIPNTIYFRVENVVKW